MIAAAIHGRLKTILGEELPAGLLREKAEIAEEILRVKREKNALLLVHNYIDPLIFHSVADITGDSLELSRRAVSAENDMLIVCGVSFMAETAKLLNPDKKVLIPVTDAGCSLAESITAEDVRALKRKYPDAAVAAYINTYAEVKAEIDICCTSGNAENVLEILDKDQILFLPDEYLMANISRTLNKNNAGSNNGTRREIIGWKGRCEVHERFSLSDIDKIRSDYPGAVILAHPECPPDVADAADYVGSTSAMIKHMQSSSAEEFCLFSEAAMEKNIILNDSRKKFIPAPQFRCPHMEKLTLENILLALREEQYEVEIPEDLRESASESVKRMLQVSGG